ncbi:MAG: hypothetical protein Fur0012_14280 [Elusimicrobiota bacterium]
MVADISLMQNLANEEIADISLYRNESKLFSDKIIGGKRIADKFIEFASDETNHLLALNLLSGKSLKNKVRIIPPFSSLRKNLKVHATREKESIKLYTLLMLTLKNNNHKKIISKIIEQEEKHLRTINRYLLLIG